MQILMSGKLIKEHSHWQPTSAVIPGGSCYKQEKNEGDFNSGSTGELTSAPQPRDCVIHVAIFLRVMLCLHVPDNMF